MQVAQAVIFLKRSLKHREFLEGILMVLKNPRFLTEAKYCCFKIANFAKSLNRAN